MARRAYATKILLDQVNALYPNRSKLSDGWLGDAAHQARVSDHNPLPNGVVTAQDFTHSPGHLDGNWLADKLVKSGDNRIKYIIWNRRIWQDGSWKAYSGSNPHDKHLHLSVKQPQSVYDNATKWNLGGNMADIDTLRIVASEIEGFGLNDTHAGKNDALLKGAWGDKPLEDYVRHAWKVSPKRRQELTDRIKELEAQGGTTPIMLKPNTVYKTP